MNKSNFKSRNYVLTVSILAVFYASILFAARTDMGIRTYNICDYGAIGDGTTLNSEAIQKAIDACHADSGGTVLVPAGDFLTGTIELKSNVTLHVSVKGRILGSENSDDYSEGNGVPPGNGNIVMIYAANAHNITIEGRGTIDGSGAAWFTGHGDGSGPRSLRSANYQVNRARPHLVIFYNCRNLSIEDALFTNSAYHCFRILSCKFVKINGIRIQNRVNKNNDGFHFNNTEYVNISNCNVACQDDACALFGSNKFVTVTNCSFSTRWSIFRFGGGHPENITVSNCIIYETYGCPIKMSCGAGTVLENITFSNLILKDVTGPISIGLDSRRRQSRDGTIRPKGIVRNVAFNGIRATVVEAPRNHADKPFPPSPYEGETRSCIVLNGVGDNYLENISLTDVHVTFAGGGTAEEGALRDVPKQAGEYFMIGPRPAYGIYARNVNGLTLNNVRLDVDSTDLRPAVVLDSVMNASISCLDVEGDQGAESAIRCIDSKDVLFTAPRLTSPAEVFMQVEGDQNANIKIYGGDLTKAKNKFKFSDGADKKVLKYRE